MYSTGKGSAATPYHFGSLPMKAADIDFFSDTKTQPSPGMREAIAHAVVGDEQKMEDPTTAALEIRVAKMLRKEAAVFLPSGTMCNEMPCAYTATPGTRSSATTAATSCSRKLAAQPQWRVS